MNIILYIIVLIPVLAFTFIIFTFNKYQNIDNKKELSGFDVARKLFNKNKMKDTIILEKKGFLIDNYDEKRDVLKLSSKNYYNDSITALGVSIYNSVKAIKLKEKDKIIMFLNYIYPLLRFVILVSYIVLFTGLIINDLSFINIASYLLFACLICDLLVLPIEYNLFKEAKVEEEKLLKSKKGNNVLKACLVQNLANLIMVLIAMVNYFVEIINERIK